MNDQGSTVVSGNHANLNEFAVASGADKHVEVITVDVLPDLGRVPVGVQQVLVGNTVLPCFVDDLRMVNLRLAHAPPSQGNLEWASSQANL